MTYDELQALAVQAASDLKNKGVDGVLVVAIDEQTSGIALGTIVPGGDVDFMIGATVQMLGALRSQSANPDILTVEDPQAPPAPPTEPKPSN